MKKRKTFTTKAQSHEVRADWFRANGREFIRRCLKHAALKVGSHAFTLCAFVVQPFPSLIPAKAKGVSTFA